MTKKIFWLTVLSFSLAGGFLALKAQDPAMPQAKIAAATSTQPDFSGTYAGTFNCEAAGLTGDTTLTITGNEFTTADGRTGRIVTSKNGRYTAVAFQVNGTDPAAAPTIISLRGRKSGNKLTLTSLPGAMQKCSFAPSRAMARNRKTPATPTATGTEVANPAAVPSAVPATVPAESPMPAQTPAPTPSASPTPSGSPTAPSPSPEEPTPTPSPSPSPSPSPRSA